MLNFRQPSPHNATCSTVILSWDWCHGSCTDLRVTCSHPVSPNRFSSLNDKAPLIEKIRGLSLLGRIHCRGSEAVWRLPHTATRTLCNLQVPNYSCYQPSYPRPASLARMIACARSTTCNLLKIF